MDSLIRYLGNFPAPKFLIKKIESTDEYLLGDFLRAIPLPERFKSIIRQSGFNVHEQEDSECILLVEESGVEMHVDEHKSVVWFIHKEPNLQVLTNTGYKNISEGDAFWLDTQEPHGVLQSGKGRWSCLTVFVE